MTRPANRLIQYYTNGHYRGFYPQEGEKHFKTIGNEVHLIFTNGETNVLAFGRDREQALLAMLDRIDEYHKNAPTALA